MNSSFHACNTIICLNITICAWHIFLVRFQTLRSITGSFGPRAAGNCLGESLMPQATVLTCADSGEGGKLT